MPVENSIETLKQSDDRLTYVPLFRYGSKAYGDSVTFKTSISKWDQDLNISSQAWKIKEAEMVELINRNAENTDQVADNIISIKSQATIGAVYLKFLEEFLPRGLTQQDILALFRTCLRINSESCIIVEGNIAATESTILRQNSQEYRSRVTMPLFQKAARDIPTWFKGGEKEYIALLDFYSTFRLLLYPEQRKMSDADRLKAEKERTRIILSGEYFAENLGATTATSLPDWIRDDNTLPDKEAVETEFASDKIGLELLQKERVRLIRSGNYIRQSLIDKRSRASKWFSNRWDEIRIPNPNLGDFVTFMHFTNSPEKAISYYVNLSERVLDNEALALWIEENFKIAEIIKMGSFTASGRQILDAFLNSLREPNRTIRSF